MHVEVKGLHKRYGNGHALHDISFRIEHGKLAGILGPSGGGKTSVLRMIAGLTAPDGGDIWFQGQRVNDMSPQERKVGFVFQHYALFKHSTVAENIAFGLEVQKKAKQERDARVELLMHLTGLNGLERRYPHELSGGQRQRVAFARALAPQPSILLLDEPFGAIDAKMRTELRTWLRETVETLGITTLLVTHDQDEAAELADEIIILNEGRVEQQGSPYEIYKLPQTPFVASFIGESCKVEDARSLRGFEDSPCGREAVIRVENVEIESDLQSLSHSDAAMRGIVRQACFRGSHWRIEMEIGGFRLLANYSLEKLPIRSGDSVFAVIHRLYVFEDGNARVIDNKLVVPGDYS